MRGRSDSTILLSSVSRSGKLWTTTKSFSSLLFLQQRRRKVFQDEPFCSAQGPGHNGKYFGASEWAKFVQRHASALKIGLPSAPIFGMSIVYGWGSVVDPHGEVCLTTPETFTIVGVMMSAQCHEPCGQVSVIPCVELFSVVKATLPDTSPAIVS